MLVRLNTGVVDGTNVIENEANPGKVYPVTNSVVKVASPVT